MNPNDLYELHQAALGYLKEHESGALGLDECETSDLVVGRAAYLKNQGVVAMPIRLEAVEPGLFTRCTILIARDQPAMSAFLTDLRSRSAGSAMVTVLIN